MRYEDDWKFKRIDKSRPPLRWIANALGAWGGYHIRQAFKAQENDRTFVLKFHKAIYDILYPPYQKWGTYYKVITNEE